MTLGRVKWALLGGTLAVFAGVTLFVILRSDSGSSGPGPLVLPAPERLSLGAPIPMGEAFSLGYLLVENDSDHPVTIDQASLVRAERGIEFMGAYALPIPNHRAIGFVKGYHIRPEGKTLAGLEVAPHVRVQIILGMRTTLPGRYQFEAVKLDYREGKTSFHDIYPVSGRLCSPAEKYLNHCPQTLEPMADRAAGHRTPCGNFTLRRTRSRILSPRWRQCHRSRLGRPPTGRTLTIAQ